MRLHLLIGERDGLPPCHAFQVGKLEFRRYTQVPSKREGLPDQVYMGSVGEYSEADVEGFKAAVEHFVVRWGFRKTNDGRTQVWSAQIVDKRIKGHFDVPEADEPLSKYLTFTPIGGTPAPLALNATPEQLEAVASARASEERARQDPRDAQTRKVHGRAKRDGESLEG